MRGKLRHLPKPVARTILGFYRRKQFYGLLRVLVTPLLCYAVLALIAMHLDRFLFLSMSTRLWISGLTHGLSLLAVVVSLGAFARRRLPVSSLAYELERMLPKTAAERLVTLDDILAREADSRAADRSTRAALVEQLTYETVALCERTPHAARLAHDRRLKRRTRALLLLALAWAGLFSLPTYQFPLMLQRLAMPSRNLPKPSFTRLTVTPEAPVIGRGDEVVLQVHVTGDIPRLLRAPMRWLGADAGVSLLATASGKVARLPVTGDARPMSRVQSRLFVASLTDLQESFSYRVRCGDAQTDIRFARVVAQPRATGVHVLVEPPVYTGLKTARFDDFRDPVPAFAGSRVQWRFGADQSPLKTVRLLNLGDGSTIAELEPDPEDGTYSYGFEMVAPIEMEIVLVNELGFENIERDRLFLVLREDQPPGVRLEYPAGDMTAAQGELVPMHMELTDDLGLLEGAVCYQINPGRDRDARAREILLPVEEGGFSQAISTMFDLAKAGAVPGDELLLWVRARDTGRSDERSQFVRVRVTAFGGNENERRRLAALRLVARALTSVEPSDADRAVLLFNETAYEPIATSAKAQDLALDNRPVPESLLDFLEREHHFTDSAAAAAEVRLLYGVISALLRMPPTPPPPSVEARRDALRQVAEDIMPSLLRERMGRDLMRRALNLRNEALAMVGAPAAGHRKNRAALERRIDLLLEALDSTGADLAALARMSPLIEIEDLLAFTRQISRVGRDFKHQDPARQQAAGRMLREQIDGWIRLLLPPLPEWKVQRRAARAALRVQYDRLRAPLEAAGRIAPEATSAPANLWLAADARMVERSPFFGLGERLDPVASGNAATADAPTQAAMACEAGLLSRMAVEIEFAEWMADARATPAERRLAAALKALDSATDDAAFAAAAQRLRELDIDDDSAPPAEVAPPAPSGGLYAHLPALTGAGTALPAPHDEALEQLAARTSGLLDGLSHLSVPADGGAMPAFSSALATLESGLTRWEADALRLSYRVHLDLAYGDPRREQTVRLVTALPALRDVLSRYQVIVPPLLNRMKYRVRQASGAPGFSAMTLDLQELVRSVSALGKGLKRAAKQLRGEEEVAGKQSGAVREIAIAYTAARRLAETDAPAAVAAEFFAAQPAAGAIVLEQHMPLLRDLQDRIEEAGDMLRTEADAGAKFLDTMGRAARLAGDFERLLTRFAALDQDGAVRALATDTSNRAKALVRPGREAGPDTLARDRLAVDELRRQAEQFENRTRELIARNAPAAPPGWWGGPAGIWGGPARRDAEHARSRMLAQFARARRDTALGFDAVFTRRGKPDATLPDAPLAGALFAWRTLHSSLGGDTVVRPPPPPPPVPHDQLVRWLMRELEETRKALRRTGGVRTYQDPTSRWVDSAGGYVRY